MNIVQSYASSLVKGKFSLYEVRLFIRIVAHANSLLRGKKFSKLLGTAVCVDGLNVNLQLPIHSILTPGSHDYAKVKKALQSLVDRKFEWYNAGSRTWHYAAFVSNVIVADGDGLIKITVPKWVLQYILNFMENHYTMYDLESAMSLSSPYAVRLYWLTCNLKKPLTFSVQMLRDMLGTADKYPSTKDFIRRVIAPSAAQLESKNYNGFSFRSDYKHNKIVSITFFPVRRQEFTDNQLTAQIHASNSWIQPNLRAYLVNQFDFTADELAHHKATWMEFVHLENWQQTITEIAHRAHSAEDPKAYVIGAVKSEVRDAAVGNNEDK